MYGLSGGHLIARSHLCSLQCCSTVHVFRTVHHFIVMIVFGLSFLSSVAFLASTIACSVCRVHTYACHCLIMSSQLSSLHVSVILHTAYRLVHKKLSLCESKNTKYLYFIRSVSYTHLTLPTILRV